MFVEPCNTNYSHLTVRKCYINSIYKAIITIYFAGTFWRSECSLLLDDKNKWNVEKSDKNSFQVKKIDSHVLRCFCVTG